MLSRTHARTNARCANEKLSVNLGFPSDFSQPDFVASLEKVIQACSDNGKTPGILTKSGFEQQHKDLGFRFMAAGADSHAVVQAMDANLAMLRE